MTDMISTGVGENAEWMMTDDDGIQFFVEPGVGVGTNDIATALKAHPELRSMASWVNMVNPGYAASGHRNSASRGGGIIERDRYVSPDGVFDQFKVARDASIHDDAVSNVLETTEALVFNTISVDCADPDEEDVWNQIIEEMDLERHIHEMWREMFTYSQFNVAMRWGGKEYAIEGKGERRARRKKYSVQTIVQLSILDQMKVVPVGNFLFGDERLAWVANRTESENIDNVLAGTNTTDQTATNLLTGRVVQERKDKVRLSELLGSGNYDNLFYMNEALVFRHTATKPDYEKFAPVRMASIFELLDLKHQLRQMDRVHLLAGTNFIVLIKKGSDKQPATAGEITNLNANVKTVARTPLIVGDHRLAVEIITPKMDATLDPKRYNNLDSRIMARLYQMFHLGGFTAGASGDDSVKLIRVVARGLESRRRSIRKAVEKNILYPIWNANSNLKTKPELQFTPRHVALDFDPNFIRLMSELYTDGSLSRETMLGLVDHNQEVEARRRQIEKEVGFDDIFEPRNRTPAQVGTQEGGNKNGGGHNEQSTEPNPVPRRPNSDMPESQKRKRNENGN